MKRSIESIKHDVYGIVLHSPMGLKRGTLTLYCENELFLADIYLMQHLNHFTAEITSADKYCFKGNLWALVGDATCTIYADIKDGNLSAIAHTSKGNMNMDGQIKR